MAGLGPLFGISWVQSVRAGLLLAAGGEFAFVAFGSLLPIILVTHYRDPLSSATVQHATCLVQ